MLRTEVVKTKNIRKTTFFKIANTFALVVLFVYIILSFNVLGDGSSITQLFRENYNSIVKPIVFAVILILVGFSMYIKTMLRSSKRLGTIEIDENEIRYIEDEVLLYTIAKKDIQQITFSYFSTRMRQNPMGALNYLVVYTNNGIKEFEIQLGTTIDKIELAELLRNYNKDVPVKISFQVSHKKLFGDKDLKL